MMTVTVLLFASYADALGASELSLSVPAGSTVRDVLASMTTLPGADRLPPRPLIAVDAVYATADTTLHGGEEIALIPPVAGG